MNYFYNNTCELHDEDNEVTLYTLKDFPIKMGVYENLQNNYSSMSFVYNEKSDLLYVKPLISPEYLYSRYHGAGTVGKIWQDHHIEFAEFILKHSANVNDIMEIGGASGVLYQHINDSKHFNYLIVDPSKQNFNIPAISEIFNPQNEYGSFDLIIHSHTLEHIINPITFLKGIFKNLNNNGIMIGSIPNMNYGLKNGFTNTIMFEHHYYLDIDVLKRFLSRAGFKVLEFKYFRNHSIFFAAEKSSVDNFEENTSKSEIKELGINYINKIKAKINAVKELVLRNKDERVFLFGAHIFSQLYLSQIGEKYFTAILDNDPNKSGGKLYGYNINVFLPKDIIFTQNDLIIIDSGQYNDEIINGLVSIGINANFIKM